MIQNVLNYTNFLRTNRSSHRGCSVKKGFLRNFAKFTGKHLFQRLFFNKVAGLRPAILLSLWNMCFPVNLVKFPRTSFLQNTSGGCFWMEGVDVKAESWVGSGESSASATRTTDTSS